MMRVQQNSEGKKKEGGGVEFLFFYLIFVKSQKGFITNKVAFMRRR